MRNRAKCKLCLSVIESFHHTDLVLCKCGEISVEGDKSLKCSAKDWNNFLRVDDEGNEIVVKLKGSETEIKETRHKPTRKELLDMLDEMVKNIEKLPDHALYSPVNHIDFTSLIMLLASIFRSEN